MKSYALLMVILTLVLASCAHPLERVVDEQRQERIDAANSNKAITCGAGDALGASIAATGNGLTLLPPGK